MLGLALRKIVQSRNSATSSVRELRVPKFNFKAEDYIDMIIWKDVLVTEPLEKNNYCGYSRVHTDAGQSGFIDCTSSKKVPLSHTSH